MAAEYIMAGGNENVIMCERGIRTFETYTRNTLDLSVIPIIKSKHTCQLSLTPLMQQVTENWWNLCHWQQLPRVRTA